jgi:GNAT superfamily N-acetyltransferase
MAKTTAPEVRRLVRSERRTALTPLVAAFWDYPETIHLLPDVRRRHRVLPRYLASDCTDAHAHNSLFGAWVGGRLVGVAAWLPPAAYPIPLRRQIAQAAQLLPALPWGAPAAREALRGQASNRLHHPKDRPHHYLRALGVDPDHQRSGIGAALLRPVLAQADEEQVGCFLTTATRDNVDYYEQFGFTVLATYRPTSRWPDVWSMWRPPDPRRRHDHD